MAVAMSQRLAEIIYPRTSPNIHRVQNLKDKLAVNHLALYYD
jgi:hypothetical protein